MAQSPSIIIMPVEIQDRELDAKLLLACVAAERRFPVLIGSRAYIHFQAASVPRGVYMAKSMKTRSIRMFGILCQLGHEIVAWDEEGLLREPDPVYHRRRLSSVAMSRIAHLIAWGEDNARTFRGYGGYHGAPIHVIGNSRIDLLRPELREFYQVEAKSIRERLGEFILINTNFSQVNHFYPALGDLKHAAENRNPGQTEFYDAGKGRHKLAIPRKTMAPGGRLLAAVRT
jgi:surface carbohydrate biosynthesis protein